MTARSIFSFCGGVLLAVVDKQLRLPQHLLRLLHHVEVEQVREARMRDPVLGGQVEPVMIDQEAQSVGAFRSKAFERANYARAP